MYSRKNDYQLLKYHDVVYNLNYNIIIFKSKCFLAKWSVYNESY